MEPLPQHPHVEHVVFTRVLDHLTASEYALAVLCSVSRQMKLFAVTKDLPGFDEFYREIYESSYHRITAKGSVRRILAGDHHATVVAIAVHSMHKAAEHDRLAGEAVHRMAAAEAKEDARRWITSVRAWHERTATELQVAVTRTRESVGEAFWTSALQLDD
ncbi:hypothetical protein CVV65_06515 [Kyrpidia spormannii]|uniref:Uncharacterized protein n=2 Tax=Kyrpidia spormannii TaxID=2055160 RepID=A0A2K8N5K9_9BACL|nr:hypothetical protein [Kyrpidia spormannii]ATY84639.1 hypothetical protein CVV65_06515 [Kyrpidia spormannii]CAB3391508.1 conserved protein of unknown function [Kyrpidia spormannii]CAB3392421.1 conserved protein of unknown function [Kyrpidia spormannii]